MFAHRVALGIPYETLNDTVQTPTSQQILKLEVMDRTGESHSVSGTFLMSDKVLSVLQKNLGSRNFWKRNRVSRGVTWDFHEPQNLKWINLMEDENM